MPILSVWANKSFETLAIIVIFRKKKAAQKKGAQNKKRKAAQKKNEKNFRVCFSLVYVPRRDFVGVLGSRL